MHPFVNLVSFLGFITGVPIGLVAGFRQLRIRSLWIALTTSFVLAILTHRAGLSNIFLCFFVSFFWFALATEVGRLLSIPFRKKRASQILAQTPANDVGKSRDDKPY